MRWCFIITLPSLCLRHSRPPIDCPPPPSRQPHPTNAKAKAPSIRQAPRATNMPCCRNPEAAQRSPATKPSFVYVPRPTPDAMQQRKKANKCSLKQNGIRRSMWWGGKRQNRKATRRISPSPRFRSSRSSDEAQAIRPHRCWAEILSTCEGGTARLQNTLPP